MNTNLFEHFCNQLKFLKPLAIELSQATTTEKKVHILKNVEKIETPFISQLFSLIQPPSEEKKELVVRSIAALGQETIIFQQFINKSNLSELFESLFDSLWPVEAFYSSIGGLIGYHATILDLINKTYFPSQSAPAVPPSSYLTPPGFDLCSETPFVRKAIRKGIDSLSEIAEIYPVGGAGDRLNLRDEKSNEPLPCAELQFLGRTLLEGLIRDLQGKEFLHYKLTGKQVAVPIAMMMSTEKRNSEHILEICEREKWFGRRKESFYFFTQPLVPVLTIQGNWAVSSCCKLILKPGGHGVIWKLAKDLGILDKLKARGIQKALLRQINNPICGLDYGMLAFAGIGFQEGKDFGFCSCPRLLNTAEGMNVLIENKTSDHFEYHISNIEYTDFVQKGIKDASAEEKGIYSVFPANTNILFADLETVEKTVEEHPIPAMMINMKNTVVCLDSQGTKQNILAGRLESLMQNLADGIVDIFSNQLIDPSPNDFKTFLTYNERRKTISVTKKTYQPGHPLIETPEGCFYDLLANSYTLLTAFCKVETPPLPDEKTFLERGPSFTFLYHPALGPLFSIIAQKIRGGKLGYGAECILEIAEIEMEGVEIEGSLHIYADRIFGNSNAEGVFCYSEQSGKCILKNVRIHNLGIDTQANNIFWKQKISHQECVTILLHGNAEFFAEDIVFEGNQYIEVPDGHRMVASSENGKITFSTTKIHNPTWHWDYTFDQENKIHLYKTSRQIPPP